MVSLANSRKNRGVYPSSCRSVCPSENMTWRAAAEEGTRRRRTAYRLGTAGYVMFISERDS